MSEIYSCQKNATFHPPNFFTHNAADTVTHHQFIIIIIHTWLKFSDVSAVSRTTSCAASAGTWLPTLLVADTTRLHDADVAPCSVAGNPPTSLSSTGSNTARTALRALFQPNRKQIILRTSTVQKIPHAVFGESE